MILFKTIIILFISQLGLSQQHKLLTDILRNNVKGGLVNYRALKEDKELDKYLTQLSITNTDDLTEKEKLAFWINTYNAFTLQIICDNYPIESITDLHSGGKIVGYLLGKTVWDKEFITINNKKYSLNYIEHNILRKMNEPRIHFAIVCASISCPELLNEAYEPDKVEQQLDKQTKKFLNDSLRNHFDVKNKKAYLSKIFDWFSEDFGDKENGTIKFILNYLPNFLSEDMVKNISSWKIKYKDYNWKLNDFNNK